MISTFTTKLYRFHHNSDNIQIVLYMFSTLTLTYTPSQRRKMHHTHTSESNTDLSLCVSINHRVKAFTSLRRFLCLSLSYAYGELPCLEKVAFPPDPRQAYSLFCQEAANGNTASASTAREIYSHAEWKCRHKRSY